MLQNHVDEKGKKVRPLKKGSLARSRDTFLYAKGNVQVLEGNKAFVDRTWLFHKVTKNQ